MNAMPIVIRVLTTEDAALYREIRLEGLRESPEAFGSTFDAENGRSLEWFAERLRNRAGTFGAFDGEELLGTAGLRIGEGQKEAHKGTLVGMYVRARWRRAGVGRRLVQAVLDFACEQVEIVQLSVVRENESARRLYASLGFQEYGLERRSLKQDGRYYDEVLMARDLALD
jgi:RimJ/RimL family protein N-acetyltransferase